MDEIKVLVTAWMTKTEKNPIPMRTMVGTILKETPKAYKVRLHGKPEPSSHCLHCHRKLTHPVSLLYGVGPVCGKHMHINPLSSEEELQEKIEEIRQKMSEVTWEGWLPKSQILELERIVEKRRYQILFWYNGRSYRTFAKESKKNRIEQYAERIDYIIDTWEN